MSWHKPVCLATAINQQDTVFPQNIAYASPFRYAIGRPENGDCETVKGGVWGFTLFMLYVCMNVTTKQAHLMVSTDVFVAFPFAKAIIVKSCFI